MLRLGLFGKSADAEFCVLWGCAKAPQGSSGVPRGFCWGHFLMGVSGAVKELSS